jgi:hypothetical protein
MRAFVTTLEVVLCQQIRVLAELQWFMPLISATQKVEMGGSPFEASLCKILARFHLNQQVSHGAV